MPCPYLAGQVERKLFTRFFGEAPLDADINGILTRAGFRRSHDILYRPACPACSACVPVRIPVDQFKADGSLRRILKRNRDLQITRVAPEPNAARFALFRAYQASRHAESDMARMEESDFAAMLNDGAASAALFEARLDDRLLGVMLADALADGYSAIYSFFEPEEGRRSLGLRLILALVEAALAETKPYVYLGYWIANSRKMAYKARLRPLEALGPEGWGLLPSGDAAGGKF